MLFKIIFLAILALIPVSVLSQLSDIGSHIKNGIHDIGEDIHESVDNIGEDVHDETEEVWFDIEDKLDEADIWAGETWSDFRQDLDQGSMEVEGWIDAHVSELGEDIREEVEKFKASLSAFVFELKSADTDIREIWNNVTRNASQTIQALDLFNKTNNTILCNACQDFVGDLKDNGGDTVAAKLLEEIAVAICDQNYNKTFCEQTVDLYSNFIFNQILVKNVTSEQLCQRLSLCPKPDQQDLLNQYTQEILKDKPETFYPTPTNKSTYKILYISDPHIDLEYQEGSNSACNTPLCCRPENGNAPNSSASAQYWGTKAVCDIPLRTFRQFLQFAADNIEVDMIMWTGDNIAHDFWEESKNDQTLNTYNATEDILEYFPNTTVYPMFGNHEAFPIDQYDMVGNSTSWLTSQLADMWKPWLDLNAETSFRNYSYYYMENDKYNFKLIALDTQACDNINLYLVENATDPFNQLSWLRQQLYDSESKNQSVFIIGHIPTADFFCNAEYGERYRALVDRFTNIIRGQFFGHTHYDQIAVTQSFSNDSSAVGVMLISPSMTTYSYLSPSFRVYEVDAETNVLLNYNQYRLDLDKWNQNTTGPIEWDLVYNVLDEYKLDNMSFLAFDDFADRLQDDTDLAKAYASNFKTGTYNVDNITERDIAHYYCRVKYSVFADSIDCLGLQADVTDKMQLAAQLIPGGWDYSAC